MSSTSKRAAVSSIIEEEATRSFYAAGIKASGVDLAGVAREIALRSASKIDAAMALVPRQIDRDRIKQVVLKLVKERVRNQWLCVDAMELAIVDHVIDEIEGEACVAPSPEMYDFELVPIDREKIKRWMILHRPIFEWSELSDSMLSSIIDFAIDKIEEGPVEVTEVSMRNGHELRVIPTGEVGSHSGRRLHRVECATCKVIVHEATSGPSQMIEDHLREARTGMQSPLVGILSSPPDLGSTSARGATVAAPAEPLQGGYLASAGDRVILARIYDGAPPTHVGDLTKRLVRRILSASCTVSSCECAIRQECINKCGTLDANPEGTSR